MGLDIRIPIGLMFSVMGLLLSVFGAISDRTIYQRSLGFNVNLIWGLVLLLCGGLTLLASRKRAYSNVISHAAEEPEEVSSAKPR